MGEKAKKLDVKSLEDLPGMTPSLAEKLREAGYYSIESIAIASPMELTVIDGIGEATASKLIIAARQIAEVGEFETGVQVLKRMEKIEKLSTGSTQLDELLGGGIETQAITEFFGQYGSGKTQLAHQLSVNVQLPKERGGLNGVAFWIDTENTFRPERIRQIAEHAGLKFDDVLSNIYRARAYNSAHQILLGEKIFELAEKVKEEGKQVKLVIVDSATAHFRAEYAGRGTLYDRQSRLNKHLHDLMKFASVHNAAVVITNQVMAKPDVFFGDPTQPVGGHIVGHTATFRIYLRRAKGEKRIARLIDSPHLPEGEAIFSISERGIHD